MCSSFEADFDGDEMTLFPLKSLGAIQECKAAARDNGTIGPYIEEDYNLVVPSIAPNIVSKLNTVALSTTMCWTDRVKGHNATNVHLRWMSSVGAMIPMKREPPSALEFAYESMRFTSSSTTKSLLQSNIGATSRRSKLAAERVFLDKHACMRCQSG